MKSSGLVAALALTVWLWGCGDGGGGGGDATDQLPPDQPQEEPTYPASLAIANYVNNPLSCNFTISGTVLGHPVSGSGTQSYGVATAVVFEGQTALAKVDTSSGTLIVDGQATPFSDQSVDYWSSNYELLGGSDTDSYVVATSSSRLPTSVKVGDTGPFATATVYTNSSKTQVSGSINASYAIEPDAAPAAIFNLIVKHLDVAGAAEETGQWRLRVQPDGSVSLHSVRGDSADGTITYTCQ